LASLPKPVADWASIPARFFLFKKVCPGTNPDKFIKAAVLAAELNGMCVLRSSDAYFIKYRGNPSNLLVSGSA
jgi:hypothetical protein